MSNGVSDTLDEAWKAAEAAVRAWGGTLLVGETDECRYCPGWWATASKRDPDTRYPIVIVSSETGRTRGEHHDPTPIAALDALTAALRSKEPP